MDYANPRKGRERLDGPKTETKRRLSPEAHKRRTMPTTMFERYGGFASVSKLVMAFYDKVLDSEILEPYFAGTDMRRLVDHQTKFISSLMGGPASYTDQKLREVHAHLGIDQAAFDEMAYLLRETLEDAGMADEDVASIIGEITKRKSLIVSAKAA